jgi:hypothetical protein
MPIGRVTSTSCRRPRRADDVAHAVSLSDSHRTNSCSSTRSGPTPSVPMRRAGSLARVNPPVDRRFASRPTSRRLPRRSEDVGGKRHARHSSLSYRLLECDFSRAVDLSRRLRPPGRRISLVKKGSPARVRPWALGICRSFACTAAKTSHRCEHEADMASRFGLACGRRKRLDRGWRDGKATCRRARRSSLRGTSSRGRLDGRADAERRRAPSPAGVAVAGACRTV